MFDDGISRWQCAQVEVATAGAGSEPASTAAAMALVAGRADRSLLLRGGFPIGAASGVVVVGRRGGGGGWVAGGVEEGGEVGGVW